MFVLCCVVLFNYFSNTHSYILRGFRFCVEFSDFHWRKTDNFWYFHKKSTAFEYCIRFFRRWIYRLSGYSMHCVTFCSTWQCLMCIWICVYQFRCVWRAAQNNNTRTQCCPCYFTERKSIIRSSSTTRIGSTDQRREVIYFCVHTFLRVCVEWFLFCLFCVNALCDISVLPFFELICHINWKFF